MEGRGHGDKSLPCSSWFLPCPWSQPRALRTHVSRSPAGRGEYTARVLHLGEAKVRDHNLGVFIQVVVQQILWLRGQEGREGAVRDGQAPPVKQWTPKNLYGFTAAILVGGTRNSRRFSRRLNVLEGTRTMMMWEGIFL